MKRPCSNKWCRLTIRNSTHFCCVHLDLSEFRPLWNKITYNYEHPVRRFGLQKILPKVDTSVGAFKICITEDWAFRNDICFRFLRNIWQLQTENYISGTLGYYRFSFAFKNGQTDSLSTQEMKTLCENVHTRRNNYLPSVISDSVNQIEPWQCCT